MVKAALEGLGGSGTVPLAEGENACGVIAHPAQQFKDAARTALLEATVRDGWSDLSRGAQQKEQEQESSFLNLPGEKHGVSCFQSEAHV